jgi:hypothetical protein
MLVFEIVPLTVIAPRHADTGPSVTGAVGTIGAPGAVDGGAQTWPPGLGGVGAAHPAWASASRFSLRIAFCIGDRFLQRGATALVSTGANRTAGEDRQREQASGWPALLRRYRGANSGHRPDPHLSPLGTGENLDTPAAGW